MDLFRTDSYRIKNEDGEFFLTYKELIDSPVIGQIRDAQDLGDNLALFLGRTIVVFGKKYLSQNESKGRAFHELARAQSQNPLQFFAPSGPGATGFINAVDSKVCFILAGNRTGKTASSIVKKVIGMTPTDKNWPIFTEHGVIWRPHRTHNVGIGSYEWGNHKKTIGPEVLKWVPVKECPLFTTRSRGGMGKPINYKDNPIIYFDCGSEIHLYAYNQEQAPFESEALQGWLWDEQPDPEKWEGANERIRSQRYAQHDHVMTPHKIPGNPYTGAGTFLIGMHFKEDTKGYDPSLIKSYTINLVSPDYEGEGHPLGDVPDWVYPEQSKKEAWIQHIRDPKRDGDMKRLRRGMARIYGIPESSEGLVYEDWDPEMHLIPPFKIPNDATRMRVIDHGRRNPCACLWSFVPRPGSITKLEDRQIEWPEEPILILYREYYAKNRVIPEHAPAIIQASGNARINRSADGMRTRWRESFSSERYWFSKMDPKSFARPLERERISIGQLYAYEGLSCEPASGQRVEARVDMTSPWLSIDRDRKHPFYDKMGFTRCLVFSNLVHFRKEIEGYMNEEVAVKRFGRANLAEKPQDHDNHLMDTFGWTCMENPRFTAPGDQKTRRRVDKNNNSGKKPRNVCPITKY